MSDSESAQSFPAAQNIFNFCELFRRQGSKPANKLRWHERKRRLNVERAFFQPPNRQMHFKFRADDFCRMRHDRDECAICISKRDADDHDWTNFSRQATICQPDLAPVRYHDFNGSPSITRKACSWTARRSSSVNMPYESSQIIPTFRSRYSCSNLRSTARSSSFVR